VPTESIRPERSRTAGVAQNYTKREQVTSQFISTTNQQFFGWGE